MGDDEGIGCETMRCDADDDSIQRKDVGEKGPGCDEKVLLNFLAREEEEHLEGQFDLHFDLLFDTVDYALLEIPLRPDRCQHHVGVCKNIAMRPRTC